VADYRRAQQRGPAAVLSSASSAPRREVLRDRPRSLAPRRAARREGGPVNARRARRYRSVCPGPRSARMTLAALAGSRDLSPSALREAGGATCLLSYSPANYAPDPNRSAEDRDRHAHRHQGHSDQHAKLHPERCWVFIVHQKREAQKAADKNDCSDCGKCRTDSHNRRADGELPGWRRTPWERWWFVRIRLHRGILPAIRIPPEFVTARPTGRC
jgi:hypothetical protein